MTDGDEHPAPDRKAPQRPSVVAAVDGSDAGYYAVRFAADEARRLGAHLELVHVVLSRDPMRQRVLDDDSLHRHGRSVLSRAAEVAAEGPDVPTITSRQLDGGRVATLVQQAENASLLVLGAHRVGAAGHVWTSTTVAGVAAKARCPVVVVPDGWGACGTRERIVVGYKSPKHSAELLTAAFGLAEETRSELCVVHAWKLEGAYDDIVSERMGRQQWEHQLLAEIEPVLADHRTSYPRVRVLVDVVHAQPASALITASSQADRLLLLRPAHGSFAYHLGATARAVLREAQCPVQVVPPVIGGTDTVGLQLESGGELQR